MKVCVCAVIRLENRYIREWVEHYKNIGFDNIILYDNNRDDEDDLNDVIKDYIDNKYVIVDKSFKYAVDFQLDAYNDCIKKYNNIYDWIAFFDIDEFLILTQNDNIKEYLNNFDKKVDTICINWKVYNDNNYVYYEDIPVQKRFTTYISNNTTFGYPCMPENCHIKTIINCKINKNLRFDTNPHAPLFANYAVTNNGNLKQAIFWSSNNNSDCPYSEINYDYAYIKHFALKTIEEYINKIKRGHPINCSDLKLDKSFIETKFFKINERTKEKEEYIENYFDNLNNSINVALCCIVKNENLYLDEYIQHYKNLGFDKIILYDNNDINGENPQDIIKDTDFVKVVNFRGKKICQLEAYEHCYNTYKNDYHWIAFFDADEYLILKRDKNIKKFLSNKFYSSYNGVVINWIVYGDSGLEKYDKRKLSDRFTLPSQYVMSNTICKTILKTNITNFEWNKKIKYTNPHVPIILNDTSLNNIMLCDTYGNIAFPYISQIDTSNDTHDIAYIKHYFTKTAEEFVNKKLRGYADHDITNNKDKLLKDILEEFFKYNKFTFNKLNIIINSFNNYF